MPRLPVVLVPFLTLPGAHSQGFKRTFTLWGKPRGGRGGLSALASAHRGGLSALASAHRGGLYGMKQRKPVSPVVVQEVQTALQRMSLEITSRALDRLTTTATSEDVDLTAVMLRVAVVPGGCSGLSYELGWDTTKQDSDQVSELGSLRVVVDRKSALYLEGSVLDFTDGLEGKGFHFSNPQASRTCACGESFGL